MPERKEGKKERERERSKDSSRVLCFFFFLFLRPLSFPFALARALLFSSVLSASVFTLLHTVMARRLSHVLESVLTFFPGAKGPERERNVIVACIPLFLSLSLFHLSLGTSVGF
jgi:hypothetical protein